MQNHDLRSSKPSLQSAPSERPEEGCKPEAVSVWVNPRIPIRWRWAALVGFAVAVAVLVLYVIILDIEHDAWLESQAAQAELQVDRLTDELKLPLLSGSSSETELVVQRFLEKVPTVLGVLIRYPDGADRMLGSVNRSDVALKHITASTRVIKLPVKTHWYSKSVIFDKTSMGIVAVSFSGQAWAQIAGQLAQKIFIAALLVVLFSSLLVFWIASRMSKPIEMLAAATTKVSKGDYQVQLPVSGNDELSDALTQFNEMVRGLAHKEELRGVFGRYLNPKLVSEVFESADAEMESRRQQVSVLFADMVCFAPFSESTDTARIVTVLNQYFELFHRIITHYGGHVDKYIGDAVMAVFNHPINDVHHTRHAAMAALAMVQACQELAIKGAHGESIRFRIGVNAGQAIVGNIGAAQRLEYTVIGDAVNVASRMGGLGEGDELVMSRHSFNLLGDGFNFHSIGMREVKGLSQPMEVGRVVTANREMRQQIEKVVLMARQGSEDANQCDGDV